MNPVTLLQQILRWISALFNITRSSTLGICYSLTITNPPTVAPLDCGFSARWVNVTVFPASDDVIIVFYDYAQKQINIGQPMVFLAGTVRSCDIAARFAKISKRNTLAADGIVQLEFWG